MAPSWRFMLRTNGFSMTQFITAWKLKDSNHQFFACGRALPITDEHWCCQQGSKCSISNWKRWWFQIKRRTSSNFMIIKSLFKGSIRILRLHFLPAFLVAYFGIVFGSFVCFLAIQNMMENPYLNQPAIWICKCDCNFWKWYDVLRIYIICI